MVETGILVYAMIEAGFCLGVYLPRKRRMQAPPVNPPPVLSRKQRERIFEQCLASMKLSSISNPTSINSTPHTASSSGCLPYPSGWFLSGGEGGASPTNEDLSEWLLWALFSSSPTPETLETHKEELEQYIIRIEGERKRCASLEMRSRHEVISSPGVGQADYVDIEAEATVSCPSPPMIQTTSSVKSKLQSMRVTLDPVKMSHRPLVWYLIVCIVDTYTIIVLLLMGFKHYTPPSFSSSTRSYDNRAFPPRPLLSTWLFSNKGPKGAMMPYWYRPHRCSGEKKMPVVFLHGIGIGLYPYLSFFRKLISLFATDSDAGSVGMVIPELLPICMHMTPRTVPNRQAMLDSLEIILEEVKRLDSETQGVASLSSFREEDQRPLLGERQPSYNGLQDSAGSISSPWDRIVLCAHSYGTFVAGWIVRECVDVPDCGEDGTAHANTLGASDHKQSGIASRIAHIIMADPIPILLSDPAVARNFLYRHPSTVPPRLPHGSSPTHHPISTHRNQKSLYSIPRAISSWLPTYSSASAWQLYYFASRDADVARTLFRAFFWAEGGIWKEEVEAFVSGCSADEIHARKGKLENGDSSRGQHGEASGTGDEDSGNVDGERSERRQRRGRNLAVVLGGQDQVVPAKTIRRYLTGEQEEKEYWCRRFVYPSNDQAPSEVDREEEESEVEVERCVLEGTPPIAVGSATRQRAGGGALEVLFNPVLDHAVIFDEESYTVPLVDVVRRYVQNI
ncbi:hypothetical protein CPC08DRAFT_769006 [Agrocybe pediades]|nr:hypothetical protein CPC08DRAFT_769006 [Agrocybe pediades]